MRGRWITIKIKNLKFKRDDTFFMQLAIQEAKKGIGTTSPNPVVGAVIAKNSKVLAKGHHAQFGGLHAEVMAIQKLKKVPPGSTLYVTLEPCSTQGKTPPCTDAIVNSGIKKVVIGSIDPNPIHHGRSLKILKEKGIKVILGLLKKETRELNLYFEKWITKKMPYCIVKSALSMDGKIATATGESKWITEPLARKFSYRLRAKTDAIMVGINTVLQDDPELTCHGFRKKEPLKIVVDSKARISLESKLVKNHSRFLFVAVTTQADPVKVRSLSERGVRVFKTAPKNGRVNLCEVFLELGKLGVSSILVEGGGELMSSIFREKLSDYLYFFYAPILIGGRLAPTSFDGEGILNLNRALSIKELKIDKIGKDFLVQGKVEYVYRDR